MLVDALFWLQFLTKDVKSVVFYAFWKVGA